VNLVVFEITLHITGLCTDRAELFRLVNRSAEHYSVLLKEQNSA